MTATLDRPVVLGSTTPRIFTRPLVQGPPGPCGCGCALTPATSLGFQAVEFAEQIARVPLLPWQRWWLIHVLELRPDGSFRYRTVLTLVARQNGKTTIVKILALYLLYMGRARLVVGAAQNLDVAKESWSGAVELALEVEELAAEIAPNGVRRANGDICLTLLNGGRYRIAAATGRAGRGIPGVDALLFDELREQHNWMAWGALTKTAMARANALIVGLSNAGDDASIVLNSLQSAAVSGQDETLGLFEWSAPDGCELDDPHALAAANPALGRTVSMGALLSALAQDPAAVFRTENMCQRVDTLDSAIDLAAWKACGDPSGSLGDVRSRVALCLDVAPDGGHVTLAGAALVDAQRVRVEIIKAWPSTVAARRELPTLLAQVGAPAVGWFSAGPAAELATEMTAAGAVDLKGKDVTEACQEFAGLVAARLLLHPADPLLDAHVSGTSKLRTGDGWRFTRRGIGHVDAAYAAAGAVRLTRTLPPPVRRVRAWVG